MMIDITYQDDKFTDSEKLGDKLKLMPKISRRTRENTNAGYGSSFRSCRREGACSYYAWVEQTWKNDFGKLFMSKTYYC
jgi:hypothetical protein